MSKRLSRKRVHIHPVPWHPPVVAFRKGSAIREAYAQWWKPHYDSDLSDFLDAIDRSALDGEDDAFSNGYRSETARPWKVKPGKTVKVRIALDYPLVIGVDGVVSISTKRFGEIFGHAHDMYVAVYKRDDAEWKKTGKKAAPKVGRVKIPGVKRPVCMDNRALGPLVWGHDMSDLVFESMCFEFSPEAREAFDAYQRKRDAALKKLKRGPGTFILRPHPRLKSAKLAFDIKRHVLGTVSFGIGS